MYRASPGGGYTMDGPTAVVSARSRDSKCVEGLSWMTVPIDLLGSATPWRTFRWYRGQKPHSGAYWSATMRDHVIYESRLELAGLLFADFDPSVHRFGRWLSRPAAQAAVIFVI